MQLELADADATEDLGGRLATGMRQGVVYLQGELGAGKTALARAILRGRGYAGTVRSPTYTLVEPYEIGDSMVYHLDLYRLSDPEELEWLGLRDMLAADSTLLLVEWPERGRGVLPQADIRIALQHRNTGRTVNIDAETVRGHQMMGVLESI